MSVMTAEANGTRLVMTDRTGTGPALPGPAAASRAASRSAARDAAPAGTDPPAQRAVGAIEPVTPEAIVHVLSRLQPGADAGRPGEGAGPVNRLLAEVVEAASIDGDLAPDGEYVTVLVTELAKRYLRAVSCHARGLAVPQAWQEILDRWDPAAADPARITLAAGLTIVGHDLPPAVVSACTLLGRTPGPAERAAVQLIVALIADVLRETAPALPGATDAGGGPRLLLSRTDAWRQAEVLWAVRGRPSEAEKERAAMDWRAGLVVRGLLATPGC
jgi:hypothetical protein